MMNNVKFRKICSSRYRDYFDCELTSPRDDMAAVMKAKVGKNIHAQAEQTFAFNAAFLRTRLPNVEWNFWNQMNE